MTVFLLKIRLLVSWTVVEFTETYYLGYKLFFLISCTSHARLVRSQAATAARKLVSPSTLIGGSCCQRAIKFKWTNQSWRWNQLARALTSGRCWLPGHKPLRKAEEVNFKAKFSFFTSLSAAETDVFGVTFIGLYGTVVFIAIRDFSCWGENDLWSEVWPAMDGVVGLPILLVTVSG